MGGKGWGGSFGRFYHRGEREAEHFHVLALLAVVLGRNFPPATADPLAVLQIIGITDSVKYSNTKLGRKH